MDRDFRAEKLAQVHPRVLKHSQLADLTREYSLNEIAIITRAGPAKILGLANKGHLGVGADADICIYSPDANYQKMFELPWMVIKAGHVLIEDTEIRQTISGQTIMAQPNYNRGDDQKIEMWFEQEYSLPLKQFAVDTVIRSG